MIYYLPWIMLIAASLLVSLGGFLWALKSGQFSDQERARYLPLRDELEPGGRRLSSRFSREIYALFFVLLMGALVLVAALVVIVSRTGSA